MKTSRMAIADGCHPEYLSEMVLVRELFQMDLLASRVLQLLVQPAWEPEVSAGSEDRQQFGLLNLRQRP